MDPKSFKIYTKVHRSPWAVLRQFLWELTIFIAAIIIIPFFLPISLIFRIYRHTLIRMIHNRTNGKAEVMNGDDAVWMQDTPQNPAVINSLILVQGTPDIDQLRHIFLERVVKAVDDEGEPLCPKFMCYSDKMLRRYIWVKDENFDVANHVYMWEGEIPKTRSEIQTLTSVLCSTPMPPKKPSWQVVIIPPAPDTQEFHMVMRVHHSVADGVSIIRLLMLKFVDVHPKIALPERFASHGRLLRAIKGIFSGPAMIIDRVLWKADDNILHGPNLSGQKIFAWSDHIDLKLVKRIKEVTGTTVNDVVMSCLAGSFREFMKKYCSDVPQSLLAYVPVDIRPPSKKLVLDNQFALVFLELPTKYNDSLQCLRETKIRMDRIKTSAEPLVNALAITYSMARMPNWLTRVVFDNVSSKCCMVLSNVPGPQHKLFVGGNAIESMIFWPPQRTNVGIGVSIFSYNGSIKVGVTTDKVIMTNPGLLCDHIVRTFYDLAEELGVLDDQGDNDKH